MSRQTKLIHVAVGIIFNAEQHILMARRLEHKHEGGKWEFPGGKIELGETVQQALARELQEEVAIEVRKSEPFLKVQYDYFDKIVLLDTWLVTEFGGAAHGREGQLIRWVSQTALAQLDIPAANHAILAKLESLFFNRN